MPVARIEDSGDGTIPLDAEYKIIDLVLMSTAPSRCTSPRSSSPASRSRGSRGARGGALIAILNALRSATHRRTAAAVHARGRLPAGPACWTPGWSRSRRTSQIARPRSTASSPRWSSRWSRPPSRSCRGAPRHQRRRRLLAARHAAHRAALSAPACGDQRAGHRLPGDRRPRPAGAAARHPRRARARDGALARLGLAPALRVGDRPLVHRPAPPRPGCCSAPTTTSPPSAGWRRSRAAS